VNEDVVTFDLYDVRCRSFGRRHRTHFSIRDVEFRSVSWARDRIAVEDSITKRTAIVRADIFQASKGPANVKQNHQMIVDFQQLFARIGDVGRLGYFDEFAHVGGHSRQESSFINGYACGSGGRRRVAAIRIRGLGVQSQDPTRCGRFRS